MAIIIIYLKIQYAWQIHSIYISTNIAPLEGQGRPVHALGDA